MGVKPLCYVYHDDKYGFSWISENGSKNYRISYSKRI